MFGWQLFSSVLGIVASILIVYINVFRFNEVDESCIEAGVIVTMFYFSPSQVLIGACYFVYHNCVFK